MTDAERKAYSDGYRRAMREALEDLAHVHKTHSKDMPVRKVVDIVWDRFKTRLNLFKSEGFGFNGE